MSKAIIITKENKANNPTQLKHYKVGDIAQFTERNFPKVWNNANVNYNSNLLEFLNIIKPTLQVNERYLPLTISDCDLEKGTATYRVEQIPEPTAQELYDVKIEEFEMKRDEFIDKLVKANYEDVVLDETTEDFKTLIRQLKTVRTRVRTDLQGYLDTNDKQKLKDFTFNTDEAAYLDAEIKKYRDKKPI